MTRFALLVMLASGCQWIAEIRKPSEKPVELPLAHADWVDGSFHIGEELHGTSGPALRVEFWNEPPEGADWRMFDVTLTGPDGTYTLSHPDFTYWQDEWPAGTYKLTLRQSGRVVTEREFKVAMPPDAFGKPYPTIVPDGPHVISPKDQDLYTFLPVNVTTPGYKVAVVWVKDHRVVRTAAVVMDMPPLWEMSRLGEWQRLDISTKEVSSLGAATVMLFVNGGGLYGAWSWTKDQQVPAMSLPSVTPDPKDLAIARAAAREKSKEVVVDNDPLAGPHDEALSCAVAKDAATRDAFLEYRQHAFGAGIDDRDADDESSRAENDDALTERQRVRMRKDAARLRESAGFAAQHEGDSLARAMKLSRKYKKGCLAAMGVPSIPVANHGG